MKKILPVIIFLFISYNGFAQLEVGKSKAQLESEKPKRVGVKATLLNVEYELCSVDKDGQHTEYLTYEVVASNGVYHIINFSSLKEEADFYKYVLDLFDNFKDNEIMLKSHKIVPHAMKVGSLINNLIFDVHETRDTPLFSTTVGFSKKAWIKLFKDSKIQSLL